MKKRSLSIRAIVSLLAVSMLTLLGVPTANAVDGTSAIATIAGTGTAGDGADGPDATASALDSPRNVAIAADGTVYVADTNNNKVRKITPAGAISTFAGTGTAAYSGDGGQANLAELSGPQGVAVDAAGVVYIADSGNNRVRAVANDGVITTFAGTGVSGSTGDGAAATLARLSSPVDVALSSTGIVYIVDHFSQKIRAVATDGNISTFAGTGDAGAANPVGPATAAELNHPRGVAVDKNDVVYIADTFNHLVRKVDAAGNISTVAGTGSAGSTGDGGQATSAQVFRPGDVAVDADLKIYIGDSDNNLVRMVATDGVISTIAGGADGGAAGTAGASTLVGPSGVAVDSAGSLFVAELGAHQVLKISDASAPDTTDPVVTITSPADGSTVALDAVVEADFACTDAGSGIDTCVATLDGVAIVDGATIDTATAGDMVLSVTGTDGAGNDATVTSTFTVEDSSEPDSRIITGAYAGSSGNTAVIARLYVAILKRQPETAGHEYWMSQIAAGVRIQDITAFFVVSPEFQLVYGDTTNEEFVDLLYQNVMHRPGEATGRAYWIGELDKGWPRLELALFFSQSDEFKIHTQTS